MYLILITGCLQLALVGFLLFDDYGDAFLRRFESFIKLSGLQLAEGFIIHHKSAVRVALACQDTVLLASFVVET